MTLTDLEKESLDITKKNLVNNDIDGTNVEVEFCRWG